MSAPASDSGPQQAKPPEPRQTGPDVQRPEVHALLEKYWRTNVTITIVLLVVWAIVGLGLIDERAILDLLFRRHHLRGVPADRLA